MFQKPIITIAGNAQISTAQSKFGGASALFDGTGDWIVGELGADTFGSGDFTLEYFVRYSSFFNYITNFATERSANGFNCGTQASAQVVFYVSGLGEVLRGTGTNFTADTWHHVEFDRSGSTLKAYVDGVEKASATNSTNFSKSKFTIGDILSAGEGIGGEGFIGYMDEIRISNIARHTSGFTPPTEQYNPDANTVLLLHTNQYFVDESVKRTLGEYLGSGSSTTKLLMHLNGSSADASGNSNNGTDTSVDYGTGYGNIGKGARFNGNDWRIKFGDNLHRLNTTGYITFATSIYIHTAGDGVFADSSQNDDYGEQWNVQYDTSTGKFRMRSSNDNAGVNGMYQLSTAQTLNTGTWYRYVAVFKNGDNNNWKQYLNGKDISGTTQYWGSGSTSTVTWTNGTANLVLGALASGGGFSEEAECYLDETIVEQTAWTPSMVMKDYTYLKGRFGII